MYPETKLTKLSFIAHSALTNLEVSLALVFNLAPGGFPSEVHLSFTSLFVFSKTQVGLRITDSNGCTKSNLPLRVDPPPGIVIIRHPVGDAEGGLPLEWFVDLHEYHAMSCNN